MILGLIKALTGTELKVLFTIMVKSNERYEYNNMENIIESMDISYPTILKTIEVLEKKGCIKKIDIGAICVLRISQDFIQVASYLKKAPNQLELFSEEAEEIKSTKWWTKKDQDEVIQWYAIERGVPIEKIKEWNSANYVKNIDAARRLMDYCGSLEAARVTITNCRIERAKKKISWSMSGDVLRNIQDYAPKSGIVGGVKQWR